MSDPSQITYKDYTVQAGDSLQSIAKIELGDARLSTPLYRLNKNLIGDDPDKLRPGMVLRVPELPQTKPEPKLERKRLSSYEFDDVNVWGHRWVSLMRAIKTTLEIAEESAVYLKARSARSASGENVAADQGYIDDEDYIDPTVEDEGRDFDETVTRASEQNISEQEQMAEQAAMEAARRRAIEEELAQSMQGSDTEVEVNTRAGSVWSEQAKRQLPEKQAAIFEDVERRQHEIIYNLLLNLSRFVDIDMGKYIAVLTPPRWQPAAGRNRPPSALLRSLTENVAKDFEIFSKALQQRQRIPTSGGEPAVSLQSLTLLQADKLAMRALAAFQPFLTSKDVVNTISYFDSHMHIRQIPYDDQVILIGIPYASVSFWNDKVAYDELTNFDEDILGRYQNRLPFDFMAIPHEIGHFIYHFGAMPHATISDFFGPKHVLPSRYTGWSEEIFADIVGCFIAGPLAVMGMQSLLAGIYEGDLFEDDGHHPIAAIRPFIMSQILRRLSAHYGFPEKFEHAPDKLDENWATHLRLVGQLPADGSLADHPFEFTLHANHDDNLPAHHHNNRHAKYHAEKRPNNAYLISKEGERVSTTVAEIQADVNGIIDAFIHLILFKADMKQFDSWSKDLAADQSIDAYEADLTKLINVEMSQLPEVQKVRPTISDNDARQKLYNETNQFEAEKEVMRSLRAWGDSGPNGFGGRP